MDKPRIAAESFERLQSIESQLKTDRQRREPTWKEAAPHTNPDMAGWSDEPSQVSGKTQKTTTAIYDTTARKNSLMLATGMQTYAYPKGNPWFKFALEEHDSLNDAESTWLELAERKVVADLQKSNFYDEGIVFGKCAEDFATGIAMCIDDTSRKIPLFKTQHLKWSVIAENQFGEVDVLMREFWLNPFDATAMFGYDNLPVQIQTAYYNNKLTPFKFHQYIVPMDRYDLDIPRPKNRRFYSIFGAECDEHNPIADGGYPIKPFFAWRWSRSLDGDQWGVDSPGLLELPTYKQLNNERASFSRIVQRLAQPPLKATDTLRGRIKTNPDGITYVGRGEDFVQALTGGDPKGLSEDMADLRNQLDRSYYIDFLLILSRNSEKPKTATEVAGIQGERALLSSFYGRMDSEFLEPALEYTFSLGLLSGRIPPPPETLRDKQLMIDMISPLAQMQKRYLMIGSSNQFMAEVFAIAERFPDANVMDLVDLEAHIANLAEAYAVDKRIIRDEIDVARLRNARAQVQRQLLSQQMQLEQAKVGAEVASKVPQLVEGAR